MVKIMAKNQTILSIKCGNDVLFTTDSFPVIPNNGEVITVREDNGKVQRYTVQNREYIYDRSVQRVSDKDATFHDVRKIIIIINVEKV